MIEKLEKVLSSAFKKLGYDEKFVKISLSNRPELCDYQINSVFQIAKELHKNPIDIGEKLVEEINNISDFNDYFQK